MKSSFYIFESVLITLSQSAHVHRYLFSMASDETEEEDRSSELRPSAISASSRPSLKQIRLSVFPVILPPSFSSPRRAAREESRAFYTGAPRAFCTGVFHHFSWVSVSRRGFFPGTRRRKRFYSQKVIFKMHISQKVFFNEKRILVNWLCQVMKPIFKKANVRSESDCAQGAQIKF